MKKLEYVFGHSQREIQRLIYQAAMRRPVTERLLRNVKIGPGTRVLDLGCGAGDVSMLAAQFVGPTGLVVGIDRNREVLTLAAERARRAARLWDLGKSAHGPGPDHSSNRSTVVTHCSRPCKST